MRSPRFKPLLVAALFMSAVACGEDDGAGPTGTPSASGTWIGSVQGITATVTLSEDNEGGVTGSGSLTGLPVPIEFTVEDGVHDHPSITFVARAEGFDDLMVDGTFTDDDTITATLNGAGFTGQTVILARS